MADFAKPVIKEGGHALGNRLSPDLGSRGACRNHLANPVRDHEHLVNTEASPIANPLAGATALRFKDIQGCASLGALKGLKRGMQMARRRPLLFEAVALAPNPTTMLDKLPQHVSVRLRKSHH